MNSKDKYEGSTLTIVEAVETLSRIADMDLEHDIGVVKQPEAAAEGSPLAARNISWLPSGDVEENVNAVRETFKVILNYLHNFYEKEYVYVSSPEITEGIKTIMLLVGEAAKKLDKYTALFHHHKSRSVTELKEYKRLQEFYLTRIAHKVDEGMLGKWIMALTKRMMTVPRSVKLAPKPKILTTHVFVDLDSVKKDVEYELFFIRKEDGTRFFNPRLIRNIKLVCDFGDYFSEAPRPDDPLESIPVWEDHFGHILAKQILKSTMDQINAFYGYSTSSTHPGELKGCVGKAIMALMLSSDPHNLVHDYTLKNCAGYFSDFMYFLRLAVHTREYQKLIAYPPEKSDPEAALLMDLTAGLCKALFASAQGDPSLSTRMAELVKEASGEVSEEHTEAAKACNMVWSKLACDRAAMTKMLKRHPNGPLFKVMDLLENGSYNSFDPISHNNIPHLLYGLYVDNRRILNMHLPAPLYQEFIHKASVIEEFKAFLRSMDPSEGEKHLIFNLQDRTSWREQARSLVLEELQKVPEFADRLMVVTLAKDTEFYHQMPPYQDDNHADAFIKRFKEQLSHEKYGFYFPEEIKEALFPAFIDEILRGVHRVFFSGKNVLTKEHRQNFIELVYLFIEMKVIELVRPTSMSFSCKDGVDAGAAANAELFLFLKLLSAEAVTEKDIEQVSYMLYAPSIMVRERLILPERFQRMQNCVKAIELARDEFGAENVHEVFGLFYNSNVLNGGVSLPEL